MHELSIVVRLLDLVAEESARHGTDRIVAVHLRLGPLSGVVREALVRAFEIARAETEFQETELLIEDTAIRMSCPNCDADREVRSLEELCCATCGAPARRIVGGRELEITALEFLT